jgi:hypothetical protein
MHDLGTLELALTSFDRRAGDITLDDLNQRLVEAGFGLWVPETALLR